MSYILDALKKSEAERSQTRSVSLLDRTSETIREPSKVLILFALVLILNAIVLGIWLVRSNSAETVSPNVQDVSSSSSDTGQSALSATEPNSMFQASNTSPTSQKFDTTGSVQPQLAQFRQESSQRISFNQMTSEQRADFPELDISTHVYSTDPDLRAIVVNGKKVLEGGAIGDSMKLISITEEGMVVEYQGVQVIIPILQEWQ